MKLKFNFSKNLRKVTAPLVLAGTLAVSSMGLTGCGEKQSLLEDTILENALVVTDDNNVNHLVKAITEIPAANVFDDGDRINSHCHTKHYVDLISGTMFHEVSKNDQTCPLAPITELNITKKEGVSKYLTVDEIKKGENDELTDDDVLNIINRINSLEKETTVEYTKTK